MDDVDSTSEKQEVIDRLALLNVSRVVQDIAAGHHGECIKCGDESMRLMNAAYFKKKGKSMVAEEIEDAMYNDPNATGICPPCRDKHKLP